MCMFVFIDADRWDLIIRDFLRCMKKEMRKSWHRKESAIKIVTNSFPKKYTSSFKYMKRTEVSWGVHTLYVFRSQQDKKNFQSMTLVLLCQVKLNIARPNGYAKQNIFLLHFLTNKLRPELSGSRKKRKTFCTQGTINDNAELRAQQDKGKQEVITFIQITSFGRRNSNKASSLSNVDSVVRCSLKLFWSLSRDCFATLPKVNLKA